MLLWHLPMAEPTAVPPSLFTRAHAPPRLQRDAAAGSAVFAALDLGTNNCRLLVGRPTGRGFAVLDSFSRTIRLGEGLEQTGRLDPSAMNRAVSALAACAERLARWRPAAVAAVATEACRRAANGVEFLARVHRETGLAILVISPREEALLAIESCTSLLARAAAATAAAAAPTRALLFDIGGGSTELAWLRLDQAGRPSLIGCASLPVGVVTLAERHGAAAFAASGFVAMSAETALLLAPFEAVHCIAREIRHAGGSGGVLLLGTSGTATTLAAIALGLPRYRRSLVDGAVLTRDAACAALAALQGLGHGGLLAHPCIGPDRAIFVRPGAAIFAAIIAAWPAPRIMVADRGLREGLLLRAIRTHREPRAGPTRAP